jgi:hypothetical protein
LLEKRRKRIVLDTDDCIKQRLGYSIIPQAKRRKMGCVKRVTGIW